MAAPYRAGPPQCRARLRKYHTLITADSGDAPVFRATKEDWELERMRKAMEITRLGIEAMMKSAKAGMKEYEVEAAYDYVLRKNGVRDRAFATIAAGGKRGTILHYDKNDQTVRDG